MLNYNLFLQFMSDFCWSCYCYYFHISFSFIYIFFHRCAMRTIICYCLYLHILNSEFEYGILSCLLRTLGIVIHMYAQYNQLLTSDSSCLTSCHSRTWPHSSVLHTSSHMPRNRSRTCFIVSCPRLVTTSFDHFFCGFLHFFLAPVCGSWILKLFRTGPVLGPSKKGKKTGTGPEFKALVCHARARQNVLVKCMSLLKHCSLRWINLW